MTITKYLLINYFAVRILENQYFDVLATVFQLEESRRREMTHFNAIALIMDKL